MMGLVVEGHTGTKDAAGVVAQQPRHLRGRAEGIHVTLVANDSDAAVQAGVAPSCKNHVPARAALRAELPKAVHVHGPAEGNE